MVRRRRRRRAVVRGAVLVGALAVLGLVVSVAFTVREAAVTFTSVDAAAADARAALAQGDTEAAVAALEPVRTRLETLQARTRRVDYRIAAAVPALGDPLDLVGALTDLADRAVAVAGEVAGHGDTLLADAVLALDDGRVDLATLAAAEQVLAGLDVEGLRRAIAAVDATGDRFVPGRVAAGRDEAVTAAQQLLDSVADGRRLLSSLHGFLGGDGPRRYFLALQNQSELRGTGGFLGVWGLLEARDGQLEVVDPVGFEAEPGSAEDAPPPGQGIADPAAFERAFRLQDPERTDDPVERSRAFARRYDHVAAGAFLGNVNVDADLPTTAEVLVRLYDDRTDDAVDGVIAVTPLALQRLLEGTGPITVPPEILPLDGGLPRQVAPADFTRVLLVDAYDVLGGQTNERRVFQQTLAVAAIDQILAGSDDAGAMARRLADVAAARQLSLYSVDAAEQEAFLRLGIAGALAGDEATDDLLAVTANNAGADKSDVHVGKRYTVDLTLGTPVVGGPAGRVRMEREAAITVEVDNPLDPSAHDDYVVGTTYRDADGRKVREQDGANVSWFTVWTPQSTTLRAATGADGQTIGMRNTTIHGHRALDHYLTTPAGDQGAFQVDVAGPATAAVDGRDLVYRLRWWRQPTATTDLLDLELTPPPGWRIADATLAAGPRLDALGPFAGAAPAELVTSGDRLTVEGAVTADMDLTVRLSRRG